MLRIDKSYRKMIVICSVNRVSGRSTIVLSVAILVTVGWVGVYYYIMFNNSSPYRFRGGVCELYVRWTHNRSFCIRVFPGNHLHWYWQI